MHKRQSPSPSAQSGKRRLLRRLRENDSGVSALEFGLVAAPFFALLMALLEVSLVFFGSFTLENAVEQSARLIRTGQAQEAGMDSDAFKDEVCDKVYALFDCKAGLRVESQTFESFSDITHSDPLEDGELKDDYPFEAGNGGDVVIVRAFYEWPLIAKIPGIGLGNMPNGNRLLIASSTFRNEPFDN